MATTSQDTKFSEIFVFCDDRKRTWQCISQALHGSPYSYVKLSAATRARVGWKRFVKSPYLIIHWESQRKAGGAMIEEIIDIDPSYPLDEKVIIVSNEPSREDVIYFSELGISKIVLLADNAMQSGSAVKELRRLLNNKEPNSQMKQWRKLQKTIDQLPDHSDPEKIEQLKQQLEQLASDNDRLSARYLDLFARLAFKSANYELAELYWKQAVEFNPNHSRSYQGLIELYCFNKDYRRALDLIQNLQHRNKQNISRLVKMGDIYSLMADDLKAEHYYQLALERNQDCSGALNGLATIRFRQGKLDESRSLLERSAMAYKLAATLNEEGIFLVKQGRYEDALEHYSKAQYVLPQYQKGPMLLYNIGLCYSRWGKYQMAEKFLSLALAKDPEYQKAEKLLHQIQLKSQTLHVS